MSAAPAASPALRIGDVAPNFTAETTQGAIDFHQWMGGQWFVLVSRTHHSSFWSISYMQPIPYHCTN
jgi:hypothetical protein